MIFPLSGRLPGAGQYLLVDGLCESTGFPESAGGNLVTKPFPNVFEEPLKNLQT